MYVPRVCVSTSVLRWRVTVNRVLKHFADVTMRRTMLSAARACLRLSLRQRLRMVSCEKIRLYTSAYRIGCNYLSLL